MACGGGGGGGSQAPRGGANAPFTTAAQNELPAGARIDVSSQNLFPMAAGDVWIYNRFNASGAQTGTLSQTVTSGPDGSGRVTLSISGSSGVSSDSRIVNADGVLDPDPLGASAPPPAATNVGTLLEYAAPLYPQGGQRRHVRSGPWGADLDGDGIGESFRFEFSQVFVGFEPVQLSGAANLTNVAHFRNTYTLTLRPTIAALSDYAITINEETWFAPNLGVVKVVSSTIDSDGVVLDPLETFLLASATVGGVAWSNTSPPATLDGQVVDVPIVHNALVYDKTRNRYYASVPGSVVGSGNSIATIDPATGQVTYSAPVGSEPNALGIAADDSVLYVGLDGSGEIVRLALPSMAEQGRVSLIAGFFGQSRAETIAVSPVDASVAAVSMAWPGVSPRHAGVALLRNMVMQPNRTQEHTGSNLVAFDSTGTAIYGLNNETTEFGLRRIQVLADGLVEQAVVKSMTNFGTRTLRFANSRIIAGGALYDAPALAPVGLVSGASDCLAQRLVAQALCFGAPNFSTGQARLLLADPATFVIRASLLYSTGEPANSIRRLVEGPAGQVAISYATAGLGSVSMIRLFSSTQLSSPPTPASATWPVSSSSTPDGQALDIGIFHNVLAYDSVRNVYYATIPGSVIGSGNSIAAINPSTGQVTHSTPIGSEPNALAIAADASVLYVGLDGSGEVVKLALPSMTIQGRTRLVVDGFFGQSRAENIAVSPVDATVAAVSLAWSDVSPRHAGVALLRNMIMQPNRTQVHTGSNLVTFDNAGATVYGLGLESSSVRRIQVLADGLAEQAVVPSVASGFGARALGFANARVVAGNALYNAPALSTAGVISGASDCWPQRTGTQLLCLANPNSGQARILLADSGTFVIGASLLLLRRTREIGEDLVQGPTDQIAISYSANPYGFEPKVRLFSSAQLP